MATKVKEIKGFNELTGDRAACSICTPRPDRIPYWKLWEFQVRTGQSPFKATKRTEGGGQ